MDIKKIIKQVITESAGISFEVREWVNIIYDVIQERIKEEKEKSQPIQSPFEIDYGSPHDMDTEVIFTHFETLSGVPHDEGYVSGNDLFIANYIKEEYPNIPNIIQGLDFKVTLNGDGGIEIDVVDGEIDDEDIEGAMMVIEDSMYAGEPFFTLDGDEIYAMEGYEDFVNESYYTSYQPITIDQIVVNGKEHPEVYQKFSVDKWVINNTTSRIEYDHRNSGYENGEYVVYLNLPIRTISKTALNHEIKHAYDDWNRISRGAKPLRDSWEAKNIYTPDFEKLVLGSGKISPRLKEIIMFYYMISKLETPAYLENEYDSGFYRSKIKPLINYNYDKYRNKPELKKEWGELIEKYDIPFFKKFKSFDNFLDYTEKYFNKRGRDIIKRIDKMRYIHNKK
jgi:hypothetical protein